MASLLSFNAYSNIPGNSVPPFFPFTKKNQVTADSRGVTWSTYQAAAEHSKGGCLGQAQKNEGETQPHHSLEKRRVDHSGFFFIDNHICLCAVITGKPEVYSCVFARRRVLGCCGSARSCRMKMRKIKSQHCSMLATR